MVTNPTSFYCMQHRTEQHTEVRNGKSDKNSGSKDIHHHARRLEEERVRLRKEIFPSSDKQLIIDYVRFLEAQGLQRETGEIDVSIPNFEKTCHLYLPGAGPASDRTARHLDKQL